MKTSSLCLFSAPFLLTAAIATSGCDKAPAAQTAINYSQAALCKSYNTAHGPVTAPADQAFAIFKIANIDNTKTAKFFFFDPSMFYVDQSTPAQKAGKVIDMNRKLATMDAKSAPAGSNAPPKGQIPKGGAMDVNAYTVALVGTNNPSGGPEAKQYDFDLVYDDWSPEYQSYREGFVSKVLLNKTNPAGSTYSVTADCGTIALN
ncbi:hypothetical protein [Methylocapsa palsarum]|uniref:Uncharacterized protein n=1 Tax=Methylocapsa palsarum TaxID=1612308 RepID=A0A1I3Y6N1_9HYPH|nr:hypothetical protein [Methylocapsa palsarum]SFK27433.1 hypothetical protein SAMN05444581_10542 [Methylocapsa palsarum]